MRPPAAGPGRQRSASGAANPEDAPPPRPLYLVDCLKGLSRTTSPTGSRCACRTRAAGPRPPDDLDEYAEQLARTLVFVSGDEPAGVEDTSRASHAALVARCAQVDALPLLSRRRLRTTTRPARHGCAGARARVRDAEACVVMRFWLAQRGHAERHPRCGGESDRAAATARRTRNAADLSRVDGAPRRAERSAQNNFALLAADVFHPLMDAFDARLAREGPAKRFSPLAHDAVMLADFVATLAAIVEAAGSASPFAMSMARALWDAVWPLRTHERGEVRRAVLSTFRVLLSTAAVCRRERVSRRGRGRGQLGAQRVGGGQRQRVQGACARGHGGGRGCRAVCAWLVTRWAARMRLFAQCSTPSPTRRR